MKASKSSFLCHVTSFCPHAALILIILIAAVATTAAQTNVFVPGNASGCFGNPDTGCPALVSALTVSGPATITVTYVSGLVYWNPCCSVGPDGGTWTGAPSQLPLGEALGVGLVTKVTNIGALIGVFVPQDRAQHAGFNALDGTKNVTPVGILPNGLFFIGTGKTFSVNQAGTLFLGINDFIVSDNSGGFNVTVSAQ